MGKRGPKPQLSVDTLFDTAMDLVASDGLAALSMSALSRRLGTSVSGLYRYVESKESVVAELQARAIDGYRATLVATLEEVDRGLAHGELERPAAGLYRVLAVFGFYARHASEHAAAHSLIDASISSPVPVLSDDQARAINVLLGDVMAICTRVLGEAEEVGAIEPGDNLQRTHVLWAALHGLDHFRKRDRIQPPDLQVAALSMALMRTVLVGFGASSADLEPALALHARRRAAQRGSEAL